MHRIKWTWKRENKTSLVIELLYAYTNLYLCKHKIDIYKYSIFLPKKKNYTKYISA